MLLRMGNSDVDRTTHCKISGPSFCITVSFKLYKNVNLSKRRVENVARLVRSSITLWHYKSFYSQAFTGHFTSPTLEEFPSKKSNTVNFSHERTTRYLSQHGQTLMSSVIMHGLSIMSHRAFFSFSCKTLYLAALQSAEFHQSSPSYKPNWTCCSKPCRFFYSTSFNTQPHFQPNFTAIWIGWIRLRPLRDHSGFPPEAGADWERGWCRGKEWGKDEGSMGIRQWGYMMQWYIRDAYFHEESEFKWMNICSEKVSFITSFVFTALSVVSSQPKLISLFLSDPTPRTHNLLS